MITWLPNDQYPTITEQTVNGSRPSTIKLCNLYTRWPEVLALQILVGDADQEATKTAETGTGRSDRLETVSEHPSQEMDSVPSLPSDGELTPLSLFLQNEEPELQKILEERDDPKAEAQLDKLQQEIDQENEKLAAFPLAVRTSP